MASFSIQWHIYVLANSHFEVIGSHLGFCPLAKIVRTFRSDWRAKFSFQGPRMSNQSSNQVWERKVTECNFLTNILTIFVLKTFFLFFVRMYLCNYLESYTADFFNSSFKNIFSMSLEHLARVFHWAIFCGRGKSIWNSKIAKNKNSP